MNLDAAVDAAVAAELANVGAAWEAAGLGEYGPDTRDPDMRAVDRERVTAAVSAAAVVIEAQVRAAIVTRCKQERLAIQGGNPNAKGAHIYDQGRLYALSVAIGFANGTVE